MEVRWLGDFAVEIRTSVGTVFADPVSPNIDTGRRALDPNTVVTLSRPATASGFQRAALPEGVRLLDGPGEYEMSGLAVRGVPTPANDPDDPNLINTVFAIEAEGISLCHTGALAEPPGSQALQMIGKVDVLFIPADGKGTLSPDQAAAVVRLMEPSVVIPVSYTPGTGSVPASVALFISELGSAAGDPVPRLSVTRNTLGEEMRVVLLTPQG